MLDVRTTLPKQLSPKGAHIALGIEGIRCYLHYRRIGTTGQYFVVDGRLIVLVGVLIALALYLRGGSTPPSPTQVTHVYHYVPTQGGTPPNFQALPSPLTDAAEPPTQIYEASLVASESDVPVLNSREAIRNAFIQAKQKLIYEFTTRQNVVRTAQLSDEQLVRLNREMSQLFTDIVLGNLQIEPHVYQFFTDTTELHKLTTALVEQDKYHVPASITLAQAALESSYGRKVKGNNFFGIKDKSKRTSKTTTMEYYTAEELEANAYKVVSHELVQVQGKPMYKCKIKDHFQAYSSAWESFRAHSVYLSTNPRYAPLFTGGKSYEAWADKIGSMKQGGVGYATDPVYGKLLKSIIRRYQLDLLDH